MVIYSCINKKKVFTDDIKTEMNIIEIIFLILMLLHGFNFNNNVMHLKFVNLL